MQEEMYAIKYGSIARVPDLVAFPADDTQVLRLIDAAARFNACLIPFGGESQWCLLGNRRGCPR